MNKEEIVNKNIWQILGKALAISFPAAFGCGIAVVLVGLFFNALYRWGIPGFWGLVVFFGLGYFASLAYYLNEYKYRRDRMRKSTAEALILYWRGKLEEEGKPQPDESLVDYVRNEFIERIKCWAWFDPTLWSQYYPDEKYSHNIIEIADGAIAKVEQKVKRFEDTGNI